MEKSPRSSDKESYNQIPIFWGQYSSYFPVKNRDVNPRLPSECSINLVQVLSRHGARHPSSRSIKHFTAVLRKIKTAIVTIQGPIPPKYEFLRTFEYSSPDTTRQTEDGHPQDAMFLTDYGHQQMKDSGRRFYELYETLARDQDIFIRTAGQKRMNQSAIAFSNGFKELKGEPPFIPEGESATFQGPSTSQGRVPPPSPIDVAFDPSGDKINPLKYTEGRCPAFSRSKNRGNWSQEAWAKIFTRPIRKRLIGDLPGLELGYMDVVNLMNLCPFETVKLKPHEDPSKFCKLFNLEEWKAFDYYHTLGKWYSFGPGSFLGPTQGVAWSNELLARLNNDSQYLTARTNAGLDYSQANFPYERVLYADFTSDNTIGTIFGALKLYNVGSGFSRRQVQRAEDKKGFSAAWTTPFGARTYFERMSCANNEQFVRVLVNDRIISLDGCEGDEYGRCSLNQFNNRLGFVHKGGNVGICWSRFWRLWQYGNFP